MIFAWAAGKIRVGMVTRLDSSPKLRDNCSMYSASYLVGKRVLSM